MSSDEVVFNICRTCLSEAEDLRSIFKAGKVCDEITTLADMLAMCTSIECFENDQLPPHICTKCILQLSKAYIFRQMCIKSNSKLREDSLIKIGNEEILHANTEYLYEEEIIDQGDEGNINEQEEDGIEIIELEIEEKDTSDSHHNSTDDSQLESNCVTETVNEHIDDQVEQIQYFDQQELYTLNKINNDNDNSVTKTPEDSLAGVQIENSSISDIASSSRVSNNQSPIKKKNSPTRKRSRTHRRKLPATFKCDECGKVLSNHSSFKYHKQLHSDATPYLCSVCGEGFKTRNSYDGHMTTHNENNPHTCEICGKSYRQANSLKSHFLTHTGEKPFRCNICGKGSTQKSGFKKHMLTHTGEKPYVCEQCGKKFRFSSNLISHMRIHSGVKPYACTVCDKHFVNGIQLKQHAFVHTKEKPYPCNQCGKKFNRKSSLATHASLHTGIRNHTCPLCEKAYAQLQCLNNHIRSHYKEEFTTETTITSTTTAEK